MADQAPSTFSKVRKIVSGILLVVLVVVIILFFKKPVPVAEPMSPAAVTENARSFQQKMTEFTQPAASSSSDAPAEVHFTTEEIQAALIEATREGASPSGGALAAPAPSGSSGSAQPSPSATAPNGQQMTLQSEAPVVTFVGDTVRGQFQASLAGQPVTVTVAGHLGAADGYVTFDPTEFRIGDAPIPVSMVNAQLQKKIQEEHDKMKLPDGIAGLRVENGQLIITRK